MPGNENVSALVLRRADYRDYDRMVTLLTAEKGRIEAVVRGCRRAKSELMNAAEPFVCGQYQLFYNHDRYSVVQCRVTDGFYPLREDYDRLSAGAEWLRILEKVSVENLPSEALFRLALDALSYLSYSSLPEKLLTTMFYLKLSYLSGFAPAADKCALCGRAASETRLGFDAGRGGCVCALCAPNAKSLSEGARRVLLKAPKAPFKSVEMLKDYPDTEEAGERIREIVKNWI